MSEISEWGCIWKSRENQSMSKNVTGLEVVHFRRLNNNPKKKAEYCASLLSQNIHIVNTEPRIPVSEEEIFLSIKRYADLFSRMLLHVCCIFFLCITSNSFLLLMCLAQNVSCVSRRMPCVIPSHHPLPVQYWTRKAPLAPSQKQAPLVLRGMHTHIGTKTYFLIMKWLKSKRIEGN